MYCKLRKKCSTLKTCLIYFLLSLFSLSFSLAYLMDVFVLVFIKGSCFRCATFLSLYYYLYKFNNFHINLYCAHKVSLLQPISQLFKIPRKLLT